MSSCISLNELTASSLSDLHALTRAGSGHAQTVRP